MERASPAHRLVDLDDHRHYNVFNDQAEHPWRHLPSDWLNKHECRDMGLLLNYADGRNAIFDTGIFNHRKNNQDNKSFILEMELESPP